METTKGYFIRFYGAKATVVWENVERVGTRFHVEHLLELNRKKTYKGVLSSGSKSLIQKRLYAWMESCRIGNHFYGKNKLRDQKKLVFITLTMSGTQHHGDKWIKKNMLELWLKRMQNQFGVENYFWKAEVQKNGNLHFHVILDKYIPMTFIQSNWNDIQKSHGYLDHYFKFYGHYNAPSTHVRELTGMKDGISYAMKYVSKIEAGRIIEGSIFRFSDSLVSLTVPPIQLLEEHKKEWSEFCDKYVSKVTKDDFYTSLYFKTKLKGFKQPEFIARETKGYYLSVYAMLYNDVKPYDNIDALNDSYMRVVSHSFEHPVKSCADGSAILSLSVKRNSLNKSPQSAYPSGEQLEILDFTKPVRNSIMD